ncbi:MAG TPA: hypothetical protein VMM56_13420 [Planctomycetaceae bacterium]|nr:hypothetical protein [Planctomycetaceae bacterium]
MRTNRSSLKNQLLGGLAVVCAGLTFVSIGCEKQEEKILDVKAPGVDVEVKKSEDGVNIDFEKNATEKQETEN